eukprot:2606409-Rhodomonas_salina.1
MHVGISARAPTWSIWLRSSPESVRTCRDKERRELCQSVRSCLPDGVGEGDRKLGSEVLRHIARCPTHATRFPNTVWTRNAGSRIGSGHAPS